MHVTPQLPGGRGEVPAVPGYIRGRAAIIAATRKWSRGFRFSSRRCSGAEASRTGPTRRHRESNALLAGSPEAPRCELCPSN